MNNEMLFLLIASDDKRGAASTGEILLKHCAGVNVVLCHTVPDCLALLQRDRFDILLLDYALACGGLPEIAACLRNSNGTAPELIVSGVADDASGIELIGKGAHDYLLHGRSDDKMLLRDVRHAVERKKLHSSLVLSEDRYRRLLGSVTDYAYSVHIENGHPVFSSHSMGCAAVTGYSAEEYAGDPYLWYRMVYETDRQAVLAMIDQVFSGMTPLPLEHRIVHKKGNIRWIKNTPVPRYDRQGRLTAYDGLVADISERKWAEEQLLRLNDALRESEENIRRQLDNLTRAKKEWEVTFDTISNPVFIHDGQFRLVRANKAYSASAGMSFRELIGKPYYTVFPRMDGPFRTCQLIMDRSGMTPETASEEVSVPELGKVFAAKSYPVLDADGGYLFSVHVLEDITELKRADDNIRQEMEVTANLLELAETATDTLDIDKLMERIVGCCRRIIGSDSVISYLTDREGGVLRPSQHAGLAHDVVPRFRSENLARDCEFVRRVMSGKGAVLLRRRQGASGDEARYGIESIRGTAGRVDESCVAAPWSWPGDAATLIAIPLMGKTDSLGLLIGCCREPTAFSERNAKVAEGISRQVSLALDEAYLYRTAMERSLELAHKMETIKVMHEIDRSILSSLEPRQILETAIRNIARIVACDRAAIMLLDERRQEFTVVTDGNQQSPDAAGGVLLRDTSASDVVKTGRPEYLVNREDMLALLPEEQRLRKQGFLSHIRVPLVVKGSVVGVLSAHSRRPTGFTPENFSTLEQVAGLIGVAFDNTRLVTDLRQLFLGTVKSLSYAIDAKSSWTAGHSERVTRYAVLTGKALEYSERELGDIELASVLHDVGKLGIHDYILNKPEKLSADEIEEIKKHPLRGAELLAPIKQLTGILPAVKHHHERYDGGGYPAGLKGEDIPHMARILALADAFDAMTADRPYRRAFSRDAAIDEIVRCSATQFDPRLADVFIRVMSERGAGQVQPRFPRAAGG